MTTVALTVATAALATTNDKVKDFASYLFNSATSSKALSPDATSSTDDASEDSSSSGTARWTCIGTVVMAGCCYTVFRKRGGKWDDLLRWLPATAGTLKNSIKDVQGNQEQSSTKFLQQLKGFKEAQTKHNRWAKQHHQAQDTVLRHIVCERRTMHAKITCLAQIFVQYFPNNPSSRTLARLLENQDVLLVGSGGGTHSIASSNPRNLKLITQGKNCNEEQAGNGGTTKTQHSISPGAAQAYLALQAPPSPQHQQHLQPLQTCDVNNATTTTTRTPAESSPSSTSESSLVSSTPSSPTSLTIRTPGSNSAPSVVAPSFSQPENNAGPTPADRSVRQAIPAAHPHSQTLPPSSSLSPPSPQSPSSPSSAESQVASTDGASCSSSVPHAGRPIPAVASSSSTASSVGPGGSSEDEWPFSSSPTTTSQQCNTDNLPSAHSPATSTTVDPAPAVVVKKTQPADTPHATGKRDSRPAVTDGPSLAERAKGWGLHLIGGHGIF
eukprot:TRINITY_DN26573_c0_g1_i1.p1 TRINITY_DN26573_c0_g1~~TRINITY_DN26573_c0_g1_i1.p1  ORF type:complete len:508 (-),score=63.52 TRINITY_DN26573_c0_g1_i1:132-1622(-)